MIYYTSCHVQTDKRIYLGTCVHKSPDCSYILDRKQTVYQIYGNIVKILPKCKRCFGNDIAHTSPKPR